MNASADRALFVSILVVCYNQEQFIREALLSALDQDYEFLEVVVADDGSQDGTVDVIRELTALYPDRLVPMLGESNIGITGNCNRGLSLCRGDLVAFLGGDDVFLQGKISRQVEWFLQDDGRVLCGHDADWIDDSGNLIGTKFSELVPFSEGVGAGGLIRNGSPFPAVSVMIKHDRIPSYGFHPWLPLVSDWKLWIDVVGLDGKYGFIDGAWAYYRRHSGNATARLNWKIVRDILMTAILSIWHFRGRLLMDWLRYFLRPVVNRLR